MAEEPIERLAASIGSVSSRTGIPLF